MAGQKELGAVSSNNGNQNTGREAMVKIGGLKYTLPITHGIFQCHVDDFKATGGINIDIHRIERF